MNEAKDDHEAAERLLRKLKDFVISQLDEEERTYLGVLLAPGVAAAFSEEEVDGYYLTHWSADALLQELRSALRKEGAHFVRLRAGDHLQAEE
ncbi:MAG: hypothetical protein H0V60_12155 [Actinobacteria bacterium]|nr:hypothetical protein [Actinomycetota bacterium]